MAHKWTPAQKARMKASLARTHALKREESTKVPPQQIEHRNLVRLAATLIRMLPDDKLVELVK